MYSKVYSGTWEGIDGRLIQVEADLSNGLPVFEMVGYLSSEVKEAKERVRTALKNQGFQLPPKRITVNLSPAHIRKSGTAYDLAVGMAILIAEGKMHHLPEPILFLGEVGLDGSVKPVQGVLPVVLCAKENGIRICILPKDNEQEGILAQEIVCIGVSCIKEVVEILNQWIQSDNLEHYFDNDKCKNNDNKARIDENEDRVLDFSDIKGHHLAKRAIEIAVSGHHNLLMSGSPGSGKSALAKRIPSIMPSLTYEEQLELTKIYSISGRLYKNEKMISHRPFRSPHHSISAPAMAGGGFQAGPGELSLAHKGVLFLDELPEFNRHTLDLLRQPLEENKILVSRNRRTCVYPSDFMLVGAMNPCPCGYYPDRTRCFCTDRQIRTYQNKISGPFLDRIDMLVQVNTVSFEKMRSKAKEETSREIRERIELCRQIQKERYEREKYTVNAHLDEAGLEQYCMMTKECENMLEELIKNRNLSFRSYVRVLKLARTIADMEQSVMIEESHLAEAILFRMGWQDGQ